MIPKETKKLNQFYAKWQKEYNKGWKVGPLVFVALIIVFIVLVYLMFMGFES